MSTAPNSASTYQVGGTLADDSPTYVKRQADDDLFEWLQNGEFCYVLNSRQTGKSSLMLRTMRLLRAKGYACTAIYVPGLGIEDTTDNQWYLGIIDELIKNFNLADIIDAEKWWLENNILSPSRKFKDFLENVLLENIDKNIVIFFDEIDSVIRLKFAVDDFFKAIETCYINRQKNHKYQRINFAIFGVATPNELIRNKHNNLLNIGKSIELRGFNLTDSERLETGIKDKFYNLESATTAIKVVLDWTNGQPFLTNKICKLIQELPKQVILKGYEKEEIDKLIKIQLISDWEENDDPEHLQTIRNQILIRGQGTSRLLEVYKHILQKGEIVFDGSIEQLELRLTGLVIKEQEKLKVHNKIYSSVFNLRWVEQAIADLCPYAPYLQVWLASKRQDLSQLLYGQKLKEALTWALRKNLSNEDYDFLTASIELDIKQDLEEQKRNEKQKIEAEKQKHKQQKRETELTGQLLEIQEQFKQQQTNAEQEKQSQEGEFKKQLLTVQKQTTKWKITAGVIFTLSALFGVSYPLHSQFIGTSLFASTEAGDFSSGERQLFGSYQSDIESGNEYMKKGFYDDAYKSFEKAVKTAPDNPEAKIYLNNAEVRKNGSHYTLAVVVSINENSTNAKEILRGVADAQTRFNKNRNIGGGGRLLEIMIVNAQNNNEKAVELAEKLVKNTAILGVIAYDLSSDALEEYDKAKLPVICLKSNCTSLRSSNQVLFQTVLSNKAIAKKLAKHAINTLDIKKKGKKAIVFSDSTSSNLRESFEQEFKKRGGIINSIIDLSQSTIDLKTEIDRAVKNQVGAAVLLPSTETNDVAISIASKNSLLPPIRERLK